MTRTFKVKNIYDMGSVLAIYDESDPNSFILVRCNSDIKENDTYLDDVSTCKSSTEKKLDFCHDAANDQDNSFKISRVLIQLGVSEFSIVVETLKTKAKPKGRKGKAKEADQGLENLTITLKTRTLTKITKLAKKFVPESSGDEDQESEEESEEEEQKMVEEKLSTVPKRSTKKIVGAKSKNSAQFSNLSKRKADDLKIDADFQEENTKAIKTETSGKVQKVKAIKYKKNFVNPNVEVIERDAYFNALPNEPVFDCCTTCSNKELIRAVVSDNHKLIDKILKSDHEISKLFAPVGIENTFTLYHHLLENPTTKNKGIFDKMTSELINPTVKFGSNPISSIRTYDTGFNDASAYGMNVRRVNMSRGGREGNQAFIKDEYIINQNDANSFLSTLASWGMENSKVSLAQLQKLQLLIPQNRGNLVHAIQPAVLKGNVEKALHFVKDAVKTDGYGYTKWHEAALSGKSMEDVKDIKKMNCGKKTYGGNIVTPIHCACINPHTEVLQHMLNVSYDFQCMDNCMRKPVHYAACSSSPENLKLLAEMHVDTRDHDNVKTSPLSYACMAGREKNVEFLCEEGRSIINEKNKMGWAPIHFAAKHGNLNCLKLLVEKGGADMNMPGPSRQLPIHLAASYNRVEVVEFLCENNAKVTIKDKFGRHALIYAIMNGCLRVVSLLLKRGAPFDLPDKSKNYPIHYAAGYGQKDMIEMLIQAGVNPNVFNSWNINPITVGVLKGHFGFVKKMLEYPNVDVNCKDQNGKTLLMHSLNVFTNQGFEYVKLLVEQHKADLNLCDLNDENILHYLCKIGIEKIAKQDPMYISGMKNQNHGGRLFNTQNNEQKITASV